MDNNGKVQTNEHKVNVLVSTRHSNNRHYSHLNKEIEVIKTLSDNDIIKLWEARNVDDKLELAKNWIKREDGYAVSNCVDDTLNITYGSIVNYKNR